MLDIARDSGAGSLRYSYVRPDSDVPEPKISYVEAFAPWGWIVGTGSYVADIEAELASIWRSSLIALGLILVVLVAVSSLLSLSVTRPLVITSYSIHYTKLYDSSTG